MQGETRVTMAAVEVMMAAGDEAKVSCTMEMMMVAGEVMMAAGDETKVFLYIGSNDGCR